MRHRDFSGIVLLVCIGLVYLAPKLLQSIGITVPSLIRSSSPLIGSFVLFPVLLVLLTPLNLWLRNWRKKRGRDIDAEERHETPGGFIRLTPNEDDESDRDIRWSRSGGNTR